MKLVILKETSVVIELADRYKVYPLGILEDVLVQVQELIFPVDFYVIDMKEEPSSKSAPLLLGRPFMKTSRTKIDVYDGSLTMEFDGEVIRFNISKEEKHNNEVQSCFSIGATNSLVQQKGSKDEDPLIITQRRPDLIEHEREAKESSWFYKENPKASDDKEIQANNFSIGQKVLFHSKARVFRGKFRSHWVGPFVITDLFPNDEAEIQSLETGKVFRLPYSKLKAYNGPSVGELQLYEPDAYG